ncbi:MAG: EamA family transporter RarD, partial [Planctomycetia bacterium]|nr:EamA family transporter RarD [Planctomycetia bacterium]
MSAGAETKPSGGLSPAANASQPIDPPSGFVFGVAAYTLWGIIPLFFRLLAGIPPLEVLAHRACWSCLVLAVVIVVFGRGGAVVAALSNRRTVLTLLGSTALIASNWYTYIYAVESKQVVQAGLGYFITPLANVLLGMLVLGERLRKLQVIAIVPAVLGVAVLTMQTGQVPWVALSLAVTFSMYGLFRKLAAADALVGLFVETSFLAPLALAYLAYLASSGDGSFAWSPTRATGLLLLTGPVTTVPLLCFASAARLLRMTTLGFLQFIAPTLQVLVAVLLLGEPFTRAY